MGTGDILCIGQWEKRTNPDGLEEYVCMFYGSDCQTTLEGCRIEINTNKQTYQPEEIVTITVELIGMKHFGEGVHNMKIRVIGSGDWINLCHKFDSNDCPYVPIRVNEPVTIQFEPSILTWDQEYKILARLKGFHAEVLFTVVSIEPEPAPSLVDISTGESSSGGGCLIATATFGSELAPQVQQLREIRDNSLLQTESGSAFMESFNQFYYSFSPSIADLERENHVFKEAVKLTITPLLSSLSLLNYVDMDSEVEVLGYGISLILLNVGMYFVAPTIVIVKLRKRL